MKELQDILPLYAVEQDMILSKMGDITLVYRLDLPEIFTLSNADYENLHQSWVRAIKLLPAGTVLHKQDWFMSALFLGDFEKEQDFLSRSSERFFHERPYFKHQSYLMLTLPPKDRKRVNAYFSSLLKKHIVPAQTLDPAFAKSFESVCSQFIKVLVDSELIGCKRLETEELGVFIDQYLSLGDDGICRDLDFSEGVKVGEKHCVLFSMADLAHFPSHCGSRISYDRYSTEAGQFPIGFVSALGQLLPTDHIYHQYLFIEDAAEVARQLEKRKLRFQSLSLYARENQLAKDATEQFLHDMTGGQRQPVRFHGNLIAWTKDKDDLQEVRNRCSAALASLDITPKIETLGAPQIFWAGIPGNAADFPINETALLFAEQAACFLHSETQYQDSVSPFGIRLGDRLTGRPIHVDLSDEPMRRGIITNRNKLIIGPSGTGKSFLTNHVLHGYHAQATHVVMVDVGHSYKSLCTLVGGYYFTYAEDDPIRFNPFYLAEGQLADSEKKESIKTLLVTLWKKEDESFRRSEYVALSNALQGYYEKPVTFRCFDGFYEYLRDEFSLQLKRDGVQEKDFDLSNFLYVLRPYYKGGEYDYLLNATEQVDLLHQPFIVFELDNIKDHPILFPVVTIVIMEVFIAKMRRLKGVRKMILIEEAWKAITRHGMAEYIKYLFKTARKHFGEAVVITQEIEDILGSEIIKQTIVANADCKILLDQSKYEQRFDELQHLLGLTDKERVQVLSMNRANEAGRQYKEVFISLGSRISKVYRVEVSPEEYLAYTTEEKEKIRVVQMAESLGSVEAAIQKLTNEKR
ncbi:MAG TPA: conjugal transfer protein TraG [Chitinophagaceae bacterium]|nr:conjugal transfer protein TraG [Chitinophagaceae bacterium]